MAELIVVTGPPGAGKSTVARALAGRFEPSAVVAGDDFFAFLARGYVSPWLPEAHAQNEVVIEAAAAAAGRLVTGGYMVVYDGVIGPWFLATFAAASGLDQLHYAMLMPSLERCIERVRSRTGHEFDDLAATRRMHEQFAQARIDRRHVLSEVGDDAEATATALNECMADARLLVSSLLRPPGTRR